jgi:hypothetical protein
MRRLLACVLLWTPWLAGDDISSWYPLEVGHRWVYDCVAKDGDRRKPDVWRWTATVTIDEHIPTGEGLVVIRSMKLEGTPNPPKGWGWQSLPLLLRGECVYELHPEAWDHAKRIFTPEFANYIKEISPMFCFPLRVGASWKGTGDWTWTVGGTGLTPNGPPGIVSDAFRLRSEQSGSTVYVWFRKGAGPLAWWSWHNGTYTEGLATLR